MNSFCRCCLVRAFGSRLIYVYLFFVFLGFGVGVVEGEEARDSGEKGEEGEEEGEEELLYGEGEGI